MNQRLAEITSAVERNLSRNVRQIMEDKGISQAMLAEQMGVTPTSVYDRLAGRARWLAAEIVWLPEYLEVPIETLLEP